MHCILILHSPSPFRRRCSCPKMPAANQTSHTSAPHARPLGTTEHSWTRAVTSGTGVTMLALQLARSLSEIPLLTDILIKLQKSHPILRSKLHHDASTKAFSLTIAATPRQVHIDIYDAKITAQILQNRNPNCNLSPIHTILESELNANNWSDPSSFSSGAGADVFRVAVYALSETRIIVVLQFHASVCDRTTAVELLMELMDLAEGGQTTKLEIENQGEGKEAIESLIPTGVGKKTLWSHGLDMLGYSLSSFRLTNLKFKSTKAPRRSELVRLQINAQYTACILAACRSRGIKLCGALSAAALLAAHSTKLHNSDKHSKNKYGVVTLINCRDALDPPLAANHFGFFHAAILNVIAVKGTENLWDLATSYYTAFAEYKKCNRHFSDMADINFLMLKALENPSLTASSSLRSSLISVFEDPVLDNSSQMKQKVGVEDYVGCAAVHGIGPSIAMLDTVRDGVLDCACVYPAPLHSREQMNDLVDHMKKLLIDACF